MAQKLKESIGVQDAMDNLAAIAGIDVEDLPQIGILRKSRIVTDEEELSPDIQWLSGEGSEAVLEVLDSTYRAIHLHLLSLYENPEMNWDNEKTRKGIEAIMALVGESAQKIETYLNERLGRKITPKVKDREDFKALLYFYVSRFQKKFKVGLEGDEAWGKEWEENEEEELLDLSKTGLKDFETVRRDQEYELFYIRNEEGKPYFNAELLRNIKLTCDFEGGEESFEEDPLLKVRAMQDRDLLASAGQILGECHSPIVDFYKIGAKISGNDLTESLSMGIIALFLAANPRHLLQNTIGKSALQYFEDFHRFLRRSLKTAEYQKLIAYPPDRNDKVAHLLLHLVHSLSRSLFFRIGGIKQESIGLIHRTMRKGEEIKQKGKAQILKGETLWNQFMIDDDKLRTLLSKFPNGPLFKILDLIRDEQEEDAIIPFDPIGQENLPSRLYEIDRKGRKIDVLRLPCPTRQSLINKVEIVDEFRALLRSYGSSSPKKKHFIINLQDRTSWKEFARSRALESLHKSAEYSQQVGVITLPKDTDFYHQNNEYLNLNKAEDFLAAFAAQLASPEECGFFLPISPKEISRFVDMALPAIHTHFFEGKNSLTRRHRQDFIELFYHFLILKCIDLNEPDSISFTCKDAIDTGAAGQASFYGFLKLLLGDFSTKEQQDFFRWLLYSPALFIRERAIDPDRFARAVCCLERLDHALTEDGKTILKTFANFYNPQLFKTLGVKQL